MILPIKKKWFDMIVSGERILHTTHQGMGGDINVY